MWWIWSRFLEIGRGWPFWHLILFWTRNGSCFRAILEELSTLVGSYWPNALRINREGPMGIWWGLLKSEGAVRTAISEYTLSHVGLIRYFLSHVISLFWLGLCRGHAKVAIGICQSFIIIGSLLTSSLMVLISSLMMDFWSKLEAFSEPEYDVSLHCCRLNRGALSEYELRIWLGWKPLVLQLYLCTFASNPIWSRIAAVHSGNHEHSALLAQSREIWILQPILYKAMQVHGTPWDALMTLQTSLCRIISNCPGGVALALGLLQICVYHVLSPVLMCRWVSLEIFPLWGQVKQKGGPE